MRNKVFIRLDESLKNDGEGNLFVYLYLENKTFINAHLIKKGLIDVDTIRDYKYKAMFTRYQKNKSI